MEKVPVRIVQTKDIHGTKKVGVMLDVAYYIDTLEDPDSKIKKFKTLYFDLIKNAKKIRKESLKKSKKKRQISTMNTWRLCNLLSEFNDKVENEFMITNYKEAYSRDFGMSMRSIRAFLDFGKYFKESEILESIPYSIYMEIAFVINALKNGGALEEEKQRLLSMAKGKLPKRDEYRKQLREVIQKLSSPEKLVR